MAEKRKKVVLTIAQKLEMISKLENGASRKQMCLDYGIGETTVRDILKNKEKLLNFASMSDSASGMKKRKSMKKSTFDELDTALAEWLAQVRSEGTPVSGPIIAAKAKVFFDLLGMEGKFDASSGWLTRFKQRHGIREIGVHGEKLSGDQQAADDFQQEFETLVSKEDLSFEQIYNADESGLFWKCLPTRTLAFECERQAPGHKSSKERYTIMSCSNATGSHKLRLAVIGKAKKPRSFKGTRADNLPVDYFNQTRGWMDQSIFKQWFDKVFVVEVRKHLKAKNLPEKAVLLIDNAPSHPSTSVLKSTDGKFFAMFLPPNVTALIQPMDQGVIASMKRQYRTKLLMTKIEEGCDLKQFWKEYTILDSIYDIASAWESVKQLTLIKSWRKIFPKIEEQVELNVENHDKGEEDVDTPTATLAELVKTVPGGENVNDENIKEWLECDANDPGFERLTDEEIVQKATGEFQSEEERHSESEEEDANAQARMTHEEALQHVDGLLHYLEEQDDDAQLAEKLMLRKIQSRIKKKCFQSKKQKQVTDFFKRV